MKALILIITIFIMAIIFVKLIIKPNLRQLFSLSIFLLMPIIWFLTTTYEIRNARFIADWNPLNRPSITINQLIDAISDNPKYKKDDWYNKLVWRGIIFKFVYFSFWGVWYLNNLLLIVMISRFIKEKLVNFFKNQISYTGINTSYSKIKENFSYIPNTSYSNNSDFYTNTYNKSFDWSSTNSTFEALKKSNLNYEMERTKDDIRFYQNQLKTSQLFNSTDIYSNQENIRRAEDKLKELENKKFWSDFGPNGFD